MAGFSIPDYRLPQVRPQGAVPAINVDAPAAAFGATAGAQLVQAADRIERAGDRLASIADREIGLKAEADAKVADAALSADIRGLLFDPASGYFNARGKDAIDRAKPTLDALDELRRKQLEALTSPLAQRMYDRQARQRIETVQDQIARHTTVEARNYGDAASEARVKSEVDDAAVNFDDLEAVRKSIAKVEAEIRQQAETNREPPEVTEAKVRQAKSDAIAGVIRMWAGKDPYRAKAIFDANRTRLTGQTAVALDATVKEAVLRRGSMDRAEAIRSGIATEGSWDNNIGNITRSGFNYAGGKGAPRGNFETFQTPEQGVAAAYQTMQAKARQNGGAISFQDLIGGNLKVRGWAPADDGKNPMLRGNRPEFYAAGLAKAVGLKPGDPVPLDDDAKMATILAEMNRIEKGKITVPPDAFAAGIKMAKGGAAPEPAEKPELDSKTGLPTLAWQLRQAEKISDPDMRTATIARIRSLHESDNQVRIEQRRAIGQEVFALITTNKLTDVAQVPAEKWVALDPEQQRSFVVLMDHNRRGTDNPPNPGLYAELTRQAVEDPEAFKKRDLVPLASQLPNAHWVHFQNMQGAMGRRENVEEEKRATLARGLQVADALLGSAAVYLGYKNVRGRVEKDKELKDLKANFEYALLREMEAFQRENKRRPNDDELFKMADRLLLQGRLRGNNWFDDDKGVFFQQQPGEASPQFYIRYQDIPADRRKIIEDQLKAAGRPSDRRAVETAYTAWRAAGNR